MPDYLFDRKHHGEIRMPVDTWEQKPFPHVYHQIVFKLKSGGQVVHVVHSTNGLAWTIRYARGLACDYRVASWSVIRGTDGIVIAQSRN